MLHGEVKNDLVNSAYRCSLYYEFKTREESDSGRRSTKNVGRASYQYVGKAVELYCKCLNCGSKILTKSLPKLLTLWFKFTELSDGPQEPSDTLKKYQNIVCDHISLHTKKTTTTAWYICISQLVSRIGHPNSRTLLLIKDITQKTLEMFPKQTIWHIAEMLHSSDNARKLSGKQIIQNVVNIFQRHGDRSDDVKMLLQAENLFSALIELSVHRPAEKSQKSIIWLAAKTFFGPNFAKFIVPSQSSLSIRLPSAQLVSDREGPAYFAGDQEFIESFSSNVIVLTSKERPKIIELTTTHGNVVKVRSSL